MKTTRTLRLLSLLGFLLLLAPFYDSCNGQRMKQIESVDAASVDTTVVEVDTVKIDTTEISKVQIDTISNSVENYEPSIFYEAYEFIDDDDSENAFEFTKTNINAFFEFDYNEFKTELKKEGYKVIFFQLKNLCFSFIVLVTIMGLLFSFSKKTNWIYKLSITNLVLLAITIICIFLEGLFEDIRQIKWGYYAFIITNLLLFYYSKPNKIKT
ncbi:hypothetical protein [Flavobacterium sp. UBA7682]|uniref:hypothetical protein n=1 Tax=Flavobacterium sp. UBA7682 TaxID=1946560 RepID=UPI0025C383B8|nr:hypothetical protein [Flavobacterium sp. UBA7682]